MRTALTAVCLVLFALPAIAAPKVYTSKALGFSAIFPYEVKEKVEADGSGTVAAFDASGLMYMVGVVVASAETQKLSAKEQLDGGIAGAVAKVKGTLVSQKDITFGRFKGREAEIDVAGAHATFRFYIIGAKAYMLGVVHKTDVKMTMEPITFFGSFKLVK
jgi:hypothetical protein